MFIYYYHISQEADMQNYFFFFLPYKGHLSHRTSSKQVVLKSQFTKTFFKAEFFKQGYAPDGQNKNFMILKYLDLRREKCSAFSFRSSCPDKLMSAYYLYLNLTAFVSNKHTVWPYLHQVYKGKACTKRALIFIITSVIFGWGKETP